ncbi:hypothetical protein DDB_G0287395 [Dictyostelium discoideum AX4]|uniref:Transmembrane protein n=1 Tax=Dictyostelium discoideum TaxID=44689 RepID=Q54KD7_DICDI|nr:hypothetical protein DDB_G0287395 [Dictyostelium discoideum AX4]EAL63765.1 hypothetical protein DDB_G0287395 [Dictyostelium discoideum AX4]|eukprot:XP_637286.1 hypothetical protein DDB_G0287395 [Dictyostelium discoideum AX4]
MYTYANIVRRGKNSSKPHKALSLLGILLFSIVAIISLIPIASDENWVTLNLKQGDNKIYKDIPNVRIEYSLKSFVYKSDSNISVTVYNDNDQAIEYKFPIECDYNQTFNEENYNICSEINLKEPLKVIDTVILMNSAVTVCSIGFIMVQLIIEYRILKQLEFQHKKHFKLWAIAFRLSFIIPTLFSIISMGVFLSSFPSSVSLKYSKFNHVLQNSFSNTTNTGGWSHNDGLITNLFTMIISIFGSILFSLSFYFYYKKLKRNCYYNNIDGNVDGYSLLYV